MEFLGNQSKKLEFMDLKDMPLNVQESRCVFPNFRLTLFPYSTVPGYRFVYVDEALNSSSFRILINNFLTASDTTVVLVNGFYKNPSFSK
mmetsp:Transcript_22983/g.35483  ORF Transcript_22983/g.35483 Transcript_22983/m.35483 type:complete len:90 (+) Transcript_22983:1488-1757(+)